MRPHETYEALSDEQRFHQIAILLAIGLRRLRPRTPSSTDLCRQAAAAENLSELSPNCLEFSAETRLSGHVG
jgi:hypothetical protein